VLRWPPSEFWNATPLELYRAIDGWLEAERGVDPEKAPREVGLTEGEFADLSERFPDALR
jgi:hypothetical protein